MSCKKCEDEQDKLHDEAAFKFCFVRVQNANILIIGCQDHLTETIRLLRKAREEV